MNTTAAATKARRTAATIRTWCRRGVVEAAKVSGRWVIDEASLDYRLSLDTPRPIVYSVETMTAIGGNEWARYGKHRVYLDWQQFAGLEIHRYNTGNISSASLGGEHISNSEARRLMGAVDKLYFDAADNKLHIQWGYSTLRRTALDDLADHIFTGVRTAVAAL
ncbi:hypothetical protein GCM10010400_49250 [Streptomyces aculeolatus]|uniref:hypothetical protein n=1 Tax=Streptomyces aculeolatus TaxID=270689 RepID=UPI001CED8CC3|nr:hypothetical protein [Streptomyces aculeolatus]